MNLLGTQAKYIDNAEDREKFSAMLTASVWISRNGVR
ncbi:hypothetical protein EVA_17869 [gut metagenome]|uniref:Uncharacterized protein n=1 Tax=gut metagenome TaxID=749906 RepID=J9FI00_9ZZZZ